MVGREMFRVLNQRNFPIGKLKALASERSAGHEENEPDDDQEDPHQEAPAKHSGREPSLPPRVITVA